MLQGGLHQLAAPQWRAPEACLGHPARVGGDMRQKLQACPDAACFPMRRLVVLAILLSGLATQSSSAWAVGSSLMGAGAGAFRARASSDTRAREMVRLRPVDGLLVGRSD